MKITLSEYKTMEWTLIFSDELHQEIAETVNTVHFFDLRPSKPPSYIRFVKKFIQVLL